MNEAEVFKTLDINSYLAIGVMFVQELSQGIYLMPSEAERTIWAASRYERGVTSLNGSAA